jgi:hypothetical protein
MTTQKTGLDYFSLDTDIELDDKIALIEAKYGSDGFTTIIKLFLKIYGDKGYYYEWNERSNLIFSRRINIDYELINKIVNDAIEFDIFNKKMFKKYGILTSKRIQETYLEATKRRKIVELYKPYLMVNGGNVNISAENVNILTENDDILKQSKVKESKVKESKDKYLDFVYLSKAEHKKLIDQLGEKKTKEYIEKLNAYIGSKGKKYKSHYFTILNWIKMNNDTGNNERKINYL